jgi:hypothetical protein
MNRKRDVIIALLYIILFFPLIFIFLELTSLVFNKSNKFSPATIYDPLTGWRNNCTNKEVNPENLDFLICDKNGFIKTPYETNKNSKNIYGILLLGNSVAMGEGLYGFNNEKTFASQLEKHLRLEDPSIDVINAAYSGFNTWQEHVEAFRYLNSEPFHENLPAANFILSFGGIQDFWNFVRLLSTSNSLNKKNYNFANGMMINKTNIEYINFLTSSSLGNIKSGFFTFINSLKTRSNFLSNLDNLLASKKEEPGFYEKEQLTIDIQLSEKNKNLEEIITESFNLNFREYERIKNYAINSTIRNISATSNLEVDNKYLYVYAPNYFSSLSDDQINEKNYKYIIGIKHLIGNPKFPPKILEREMYLIEKDYKESLLREMKKQGKINFLDYSQKAEATNWFLDYSHFTEFAANKISSDLARDILDFIK